MKNNLPFSAWVRWFEAFEGRQTPIPRPDGPELTLAQKRLISSSISQFQLGESSEARNLLAKAGRYAARTGDDSYPAALIHFIREENRHAAMLGNFMDREGIKRTKKHWMDGMFRFIRHQVGLRSSLTILLTAELIAVPYYTALRQATTSTVLSAICNQILTDESTHIRFQSLALKTLAQNRSSRQRKADDIFARFCLEIALDIVWFSHGSVLQAGGYDYPTFRQTCLTQLRLSRAMVSGELPIEDPQPTLNRGMMPFGVRILHDSPRPTSNLEALPRRAVTPEMFNSPQFTTS
jgi:hypothetical protein